MSNRPEAHQARAARPRSRPASPLDPLAALGQIVDAAREFGRIYQTEHTTQDSHQGLRGNGGRADQGCRSSAEIL